MKHWIVFIIILSSLLTTLFLPITLQTCSYFPSGESYRFHLFTPNPAHLQDYQPFYFTSNFLNDGLEEMQQTGVQKNIAEWNTYFKEELREKDIKDFLYHYEFKPEEADYKSLTAIKNQPIYQFKLIQHLVEKKDKATLDYLLFAKKTEAYLKGTTRDVWQNDSLKEPLFKELIPVAQKAYKQTDNANLKLRYAYQMVVLARYMSTYKQAVSLYDQYAAPLSTHSIIKYWAMLHYATSLYHTGQLAAADYHFALVFKQASSKRQRAYMGFEGKHFEQSLKLAKNDQEKALLWLLKGIKNPGRALQELKKVFALAPDLPELELLILREINKLEDWLLTPAYTGFSSAIREWVYDDNTITQNETTDEKHLKQLTTFLQKRSTHPNINHPPFWLTATAYAYFLQKNYVQANTYVKKAETHPDITKNLTNQLQLIQIMAFANNNNAISPSAEADLLPALQWLEKNYAPLVQSTDSNDYGDPSKLSEYNQVWYALAGRYEKNGDLYKSILCLSKIDPFLYAPQKEFIWPVYDELFFYINERSKTEDLIELLTYLDKPDKTPFETFFYTNKVKHEKYNILDLLGTKYLRQNKLKQALATFEQIREDDWTNSSFDYDFYLAANPFYANFYSGHQPTEADTIRYSKTEFVRELLSLQAIAEEGGTDAAHCTFLLASGYFNMTFYGNSWMMVHYWASNNWTWQVKGQEQEYENMANYYGCTKAEELYLKAAELANERHFAAMCYRLAGKCNYRKELFHTVTTSDDYWGKEPKFKDNPHYQHLKAAYPEYYDQLIDNCMSFEYFVAMGD